MRLIAVTAVPPWPSRGGFSLRAAKLLEYLAPDWDLDLLIAAPRSGSAGFDAARAALGGDAAARHRVTFVPVDRPLNPMPPLGEARSRTAVARAVAQMVARERPAAALLWLGTEFLAMNSDWRLPTIVDRVDSATRERWYGLRRSPGGWIRLPRLAWYERRAARAASRMVAAAPDDARWLERLGGRPVAVVPNGVEPAPGPCFEAQASTPTVAFTGTLDYPPNRDAARILVHRIWPRVRSRLPDARLVIAGSRPGPGVLALAQVEGVEIRADVADLGAVLRQAWVAVAPMRTGTGIKNKVLEAWAAGRPVVLTTRTTNGLTRGPHLDPLIADDWGGFADRVVQLLSDESRRRHLGQMALDAVRTHHRWEDCAATMTRLLREAAGQP